MPTENWPITQYPFDPLKHNGIVAALAARLFALRNSKLERFIFTATTGRSGTMTLSRIFSEVPGCLALHEPHPIMHGSVLHAAGYGDLALVDRVYQQIKSVNILRAAAGYRYYLEANHLFIKTFAQHAIDEFGERLAVVHLVRPAVEVAESIWCLQDFPGTERGNYWWLDYRAPANLLRMAELLDADAEFSHPFYKALWYWYEIEARITALRASAPSLKIVRFETQWFNDPPRVFELLDALGIEYPRSRIAAIVGHRENGKEHQKRVAPLPRSVTEAMDRRFRGLLERLSRNESAGADTPSVIVV